MQNLVTKLSSTFEQYKPDKAITQYLNQHTRQLGFEASSYASPKEKQHNLNKVERQIGFEASSYASPKEKQHNLNKVEGQKSSSSERKKNRTDRSDKKRKRTDASNFKMKSREKSSDKKDKGKVPFRKHCRRPSCKQRGTHKTHTHDECRFKNSDSSTTHHKHPNLGKAPGS